MMKVIPTRVGDAFQAEIPAMLTPTEQGQREKKGITTRCRLQWSPEQSVLSDDEIAEYLRGSRMNESEAALQCLYTGNFDVDKATQLLHKVRQRRARTSRQLSETMNDEDFEAAVIAHGKRFSTIQQLHPATTTPDLVARFYLWKTSTAYKKWHERAKAKKNKEAARLRQWADAEGASDTSDFHNEYCELCGTGGQLLCCDGCERAYHFCCVEPPIKDVPMGDWFCVACAAILGTCAEQRTSDENAFCEAVVLLDPPDQPPAASSEERHAVDTDGNDTDEIEDTTMEDDGQVVVKKEPVVYQHPRLYTPERPRPLVQTKRSTGTPRDTPATTRSPLLLESTNRKRQRKIVAPRRILQSNPRPPEQQ